MNCRRSLSCRFNLDFGGGVGVEVVLQSVVEIGCYGTSLVLTMLGPRVFKVPSGIINTILSRNAHADRPGNLGALPGLQQV